MAAAIIRAVNAAGLVFAVLLTPPSAPSPAVAGEAFAALVARARDGDIRGAVADMLDWTPSAIEQTLAASCEDECPRASTLLHTEAAFLNVFLGRKDHERAHLRAAGHHSPSRGEFDRRWRLAMAYGRQEVAQFGDAWRLFHGVLDDYPNDPDALVALGAWHEQSGTLDPQGRSVNRASDLSAAEKYYQRALARRPDLAEARLRVARVARQMGQLDEAHRGLTALLAEEIPIAVRAYAHLFLGEIEERQSRADRAVEHYRLAVSALPSLQPAYLSLSLALYETGRVQEASQAAREGLAGTVNGEIDGWYGYHCRDLHGYRMAMDALWAELRR